MIFTDRAKLAVIEMKEEKEWLLFDEIEDLLWEIPSNTIYIEVGHLLYGIVSMGDIARADEDGKRAVKINRCFTSVKEAGYMKAREIFRQNRRINAIPVLGGGRKTVW